MADQRNLGDVTHDALNLCDVTNAARNLSDVSNVAQNVSDVANVAQNLNDVTNAARNFSDVANVAQNPSDVTNAAENLSDIAAVDARNRADSTSRDAQNLRDVNRDDIAETGPRSQRFVDTEAGPLRQFVALKNHLVLIERRNRQFGKFGAVGRQFGEWLASCQDSEARSFAESARPLWQEFDRLLRSTPHQGAKILF